MSICPICEGTGWKPAPDLFGSTETPAKPLRVTRCECWRERRRLLLNKLHRRGRPPKPPPTPSEELFPRSFGSSSNTARRKL